MFRFSHCDFPGAKFKPQDTKKILCEKISWIEKVRWQ